MDGFQTAIVEDVRGARLLQPEEVINACSIRHAGFRVESINAMDPAATSNLDYWRTMYSFIAISIRMEIIENIVSHIHRLCMH